MKRSRLKPVSDKRRKLLMEVTHVRDQYRATHPWCEACLRRRTDDLHEITRGAGREASLGEPRVILALCRECHDAFDDPEVWPVARQAALKVSTAPTDFGVDLTIFDKLRGRAPGALDPTEVFSWLKVAAP